MARKLTDLTQATTLSADDLFYLVNNPSGTKDDRSLSAATLFAGVTGNLAAAGPDPWFDVTNPAYGAFNDGSNANATTAGISAAITAANQISIANAARGAIVWFPPGYYAVNAQLTTPGPGVTLLGAWSSGTGLNGSASTIKYTNTGTALFDLGNLATNHVMFLNINFEGSNASNVLQCAIIGAAVDTITIDNCSFDQWGGQGVKFDAGGDVHITNCEFTNCLKYYVNGGTPPVPSAYVGALQLSSEENVVEHCNINGTAGIGVTGKYGLGWMCAAYFGSANGLNHIRFNTFAFAQTGCRIDSGFFNDVLNNRFEYNQGQGLYALGYWSIYAFNRFQDNGQDTNNTYSHFKLGDTGANGYGNRVVGNAVWFPNTHGTGFNAKYGFELVGGGGADWNHHNEVVGNGGIGWVTALFAPATGTAPLAISPTLIQQSLSTNIGGAIQFNAQAGDEWLATVNVGVSGVTTLTMSIPLQPIKGMRVSLMIFNNSGSALTTTFDAAFKNSGYTDPANGRFKTAIYQYDGAHWIQQGAWSGDML